jgi:hypothetical protein
MQNWKKALICGAVGAGTVLTITGRRAVGVLAIIGGVTVLASEYPEKFESVLENAPEYINKVTKIFGSLTQMSEQYAEGAEQRSVQADAEFV